MCSHFPNYCSSPPKMAVSVVQNLTCDPVGNDANVTSEPTELVEPTLYIDDHWKVLEKICVSYVGLT